ncbi:MAG: hydrogenase maturation nickel metallochaperone HypA [Roseibium album]|uniref:Hydrogenase maturation factor HypA n=1 Tax=Roseibium album TaxID=311410 RepID=A0A0M7AXF0_9HYPH|nr:hydrogenase maturation nickel metallochaperone HypA [Roseibium album]MBG6147808.1 hydrogenase nickel incorporation protein HypA/HybF [Labrenzia sp. EL_142]MBG6211212.1 hydrogenase nickel incorporation protein HypA/HybF [Labrenzia sp. EL_126]CTQ63134.1 hydrogenase nickel incorporation protein HybF [Roseibium album]CTQ79267.1 hydrogenase nickel incorporation protein HybF [Roseibium album]CTQ80770.1 hydrogenase nickel incorporation protein HybF [Roseibium album]
MHELSLCESILEILKDRAARDNFTEVRRVCVDVGPLSCVEPDALQFGFDVVMRGSLAEGAKLEIFRPPAEALCLTCFKTVPVQRRFDTCPECGGEALQVTSGEELKIRELEVV